MRLSHKVLPVVCTLAISLLACTAAQADTAIGLLRAFGAGQVSFPYGVAVDPASGGVYVGDYSIGVGKFDSAQMLQFNFGPGGSHPLVSGVAVDPVNHDLYVVAAYKQEIQTYDPSSEASSKSPVSQFSVSGSGSGGGATEEQIAADSAGNVYFPNASLTAADGGAPGATYDATAVAADDPGVVAGSVGQAPDATRGMLAGEVHDCGDVRLAGATVGTTVPPQGPLYYSTSDEGNPLLDQTARVTSELSLFAGINLPTGQPIRVTAIGDDPAASGKFLMLGTYVVQMYPGALTTLSLRGRRPWQL